MLTAPAALRKPPHPSLGDGPSARARKSPSLTPCRWTSTAANAIRGAPPNPSRTRIRRPGRRPLRHPGAPRPPAALGRAPGTRRRARLLGGAQGPAHRPGDGPARGPHRRPPDRVPGVLRRDPGRRVRRRRDDDLGHRHVPDREVEPARGHRVPARHPGPGPVRVHPHRPRGRRGEATGCCAAPTRLRTANRCRTTRCPRCPPPARSPAATAGRCRSGSAAGG